MKKYPAHKRYTITWLDKRGEWIEDTADAGYFLHSGICPECLAMGQLKKDWYKHYDGMCESFTCNSCKRYWRHDHEHEFSWGGWLYEL